MKSFLNGLGYIGMLVNKKRWKGFEENKSIKGLLGNKTLARIPLTQELLIELVKLLNEVNPSNNVVELSIKHKTGFGLNYLCLENDAGEAFFLASRTDELKRRDKVKSK